MPTITPSAANLFIAGYPASIGNLQQQDNLLTLANQIDPTFEIAIPVKMSSITCQASMQPQVSKLIDELRQVGSIPGQVSTFAYGMKLSLDPKKLGTGLANEATKFGLSLVGSQTQQLARIEQEFSSYLGHAQSIAGKVDAMRKMMMTAKLSEKIITSELNMEYAARDLVVHYKMFAQMNILNRISSVLPINYLNLSVPGVPGVNISSLLSINGRDALKQLILKDIDKYSALLPSVNHLFNGDLLMKVPEIRAHEVYQHLMIKVEDLLTRQIYGGFGGLISKFSAIWNLLGLPGLPNIFSVLDFDLDSLINAEIAKVDDGIAGMISRIGNLSVPGLGSISALAGLTAADHRIKMNEVLISRLVHTAKDMLVKSGMNMLEGWMSIVKKFFSMIGLSSLVPFSTFTFCSFVNTMMPSLTALNAVQKPLASLI